MSSTNEVTWAGLVISFQRCGRAAWAPDALLRSWAPAPGLLRGDGSCAVACCDDEVVWLGFTAIERPVSVRLVTRGGRWATQLEVPPDWQCGSLHQNGRARPIARRAKCGSAFLFLDASCDRRTERLTLTLLSPTRWRAVIGPLRIGKAAAPPPVEHYSRIAKLGEEE